MTSFLIDSFQSLHEIHLQLVAEKCNGDLQCMYDRFMKSGLDDNSLGFWIWNIPEGVELYSPKFRTSLQYSGVQDFPNTPESWKNSIFQEDLIMAIDNYNKHVASKGHHKYDQVVRYRRKYSGSISVQCKGHVCFWRENQPVIMVGVHIDPSYLNL